MVPSSSERSWTSAGAQSNGDATPFDTPYGRVGMLVCKDMDSNTWPDIIAAKGMDMFIGISADCDRGWGKVVRACSRAGCYGIGSNLYLVPLYSNCDGGNSGFVNKSGSVISQAGMGEKIIYEILPLPVAFIDSTPPTIPGNLPAAALSESSIKLTWTAAGDNESGISGYNIYRSNSKIGTTAQMEFTDLGLSESTGYSYQVSAVNGSGLESGRTSAVSAITLADTVAPTIIDASVSGDPMEVTLTFSEKINKSEAENKSNYTINSNIQVNSAVLQADGITVLLVTTSHQEKVDYTLTVNNIRDVSKRGNIIAPNSTTTYQYYSKVEITNLNPPSYRVAVRSIGDSLYVDRGYTFTNFWSGYDQSSTQVILTANSDKGSAVPGHLSFNINIGSEVLVGVAGGNPLSWMQGWENTGKTATASHGVTYTVFKRSFPKGAVTLGGNEGSGSNMYTVFVMRDAGLPVIEEDAGNYHPKTDRIFSVLPNPLNLSTLFKFYIQKKGKVVLNIFNVKGELVLNLIDQVKYQGHHYLKWYPNNLNSGMYIARLQTGLNRYVKNVLVLK
jgi:hypothetical protein